MRRLVVALCLLASAFGVVAGQAAVATCLGQPITLTLGTPPVLQGTAGNDVIDATGAIGVVDAGGGDDVVCAGDGLAAVIGGDGFDQVSYEGATMMVAASMETVAVKIPLVLDLGALSPLPPGSQSKPAGVDVLVQVEALHGSPQSDILIGGLTTPDEIHGGGGSDIIVGLFGDDRLSGDAGSDVVFGDAIDDLLYDPFSEFQVGPITKPRLATDDDVIDGGDGADSLNDETGNNTVSGGRGDDSLTLGPGDDVINGGPDRDLASFAGAAAFVDLTVTSPQVTGSGTDTISNIEDLFGSDWNDTLIGNGAANWIKGQGGDDRIAGNRAQKSLPRNDSLDGGAGTDQCYGERAFNCEATWLPPAPGGSTPTPSPSPSPSPTSTATTSPPAVPTLPPAPTGAPTTEPSPTPTPTA